MFPWKWNPACGWWWHFFAHGGGQCSEFAAVAKRRFLTSGLEQTADKPKTRNQVRGPWFGIGFITKFSFIFGVENFPMWNQWKPKIHQGQWFEGLVLSWLPKQKSNLSQNWQLPSRNAEKWKTSSNRKTDMIRITRNVWQKHAIDATRLCVLWDHQDVTWKPHDQVISTCNYCSIVTQEPYKVICDTFWQKGAWPATDYFSGRAAQVTWSLFTKKQSK